jgi:hypothetical protein
MLALIGISGSLTKRLREEYAYRKRKRKKLKPQKGKPDNPAQSRQFIKAAKEMGLEGYGDEFEEVMRKLLKPKRGSKDLFKVD